MALINVDIDQEACEELMRLYDFSSQAQAINFALRTLVKNPTTLDETRPRRRKPMSPEEIEAFRGIGWEGDLDEMRGGRRSP